jgi:hypothetical protein
MRPAAPRNLNQLHSHCPRSEVQRNLFCEKIQQRCFAALVLGYDDSLGWLHTKSVGVSPRQSIGRRALAVFGAEYLFTKILNRPPIAPLVFLRERRKKKCGDA